MSREFGSFHGGYFHQKIYEAAEDLRNEAREEFHKEFIDVLGDFYNIAYAISSVEACDASSERSVSEAIIWVPRMIERLKTIDNKLEVYRRLQNEAVKKYMEQE